MPVVKLTARNVLTLPAGNGRVQYVDEGLPGFCLRVSASGDRSYSVVYRVNGRVQRYWEGKSDARRLDLVDARTRAKDIIGRIARGEDPAAAKAATRKAKKAGADSLGKLASRLIDDAEIAPTTRRSWEWLVKAHIAPTLGARAPQDVTRADVRELLASISSKSIARDVRKVLRWVYERAIETDIVQHSPCVGLGRPPKEHPRDRTLTHAELQDVWHAAEGAGAYGAAVRLALLTGARREEVFSASWEEVDEAAKVWRIPAARAKNRRAHDVPLSPSALDVLASLEKHEKDIRLFRVRPTSKAWRALLLAAGIIEANAPEDDEEEADDEGEKKPSGRKPWTPYPVRFHDLRRTVRDTLTRELGVNVAVAEAVLGHVPPKLVQTYAPSGVSLKDKRAALERWERKLKAIADGKQAPKVVEMAGRR